MHASTTPCTKCHRSAAGRAAGALLAFRMRKLSSCMNGAMRLAYLRPTQSALIRAIYFAMSVDDSAAISVRSLSPLGERVGVRGLRNCRETLTPHPTPLPAEVGFIRLRPTSICRTRVNRSSVGEGAARARCAADQRHRGRRFPPCAPAALLASMLSLAPSPSQAQAYPTRPVHVIVGFTAGNNIDIVARLVGQFLSERLGQPFIIENRPGASGHIAAQAGGAAPPGGPPLLT